VGLRIGKATSANGHGIEWSLRQNGARFLSVRGNIGVNASATWFSVVVTYDGSNTVGGIRIYVNSTLNTNTTVSSNLNASTVSTANYNFGRRGAQNDQFYNNNVTQWGVIDRELTFAEVIEHYNGGVVLDYTALTFSSEILHYWPLGDSPDTSTNVFDVFGSLDGVINNGATIDLGDIP
jgi:hypothetical protein